MQRNKMKKKQHSSDLSVYLITSTDVGSHSFSSFRRQDYIFLSFTASFWMFATAKRIKKFHRRYLKPEIRVRQRAAKREEKRERERERSRESANESPFAPSK